MWYCSECGKKNNGKFCTRCGTKYVEIDDDPPMMSVKKTSENETEAVSNLQGERYSESAANEDDGFSSAAALFRRGCEEESDPLTDIEIRVKEVHPPVETEVSEEAETLPLEQEISNVEKASSETEIVADEILPKEKSLAEGIPEACVVPAFAKRNPKCFRSGLRFCTEISRPRKKTVGRNFCVANIKTAIRLLTYLWRNWRIPQRLFLIGVPRKLRRIRSGSTVSGL